HRSVDHLGHERLRGHPAGRVRPHRLTPRSAGPAGHDGRMPAPQSPPRPSPHRFDLEAIGASLPVAAARAELEEAARRGAMVVTAPPGTGKTTLVPPLVANLSDGLTLVTQPRRVAVRAAARRLAQLDGTSPGGPVGFTVRGQREVGAGT